ncbi:MAG: type II toxin-antitoxin system PemK/MazF family toxin [bacterium]|nr:type II toxin-antitoxin system PemK/MazF family toxin [bacterium]
MKDFDSWNNLKKRIDARSDSDRVYFSEREIWWAQIGLNVGFEQDGKGELVQRPVLVIRKFNKRVLLVLPLSTKHKPGNRYYFNFVCPDGVERSAILSQLRLIDIKRLTERMFVIEEKIFLGIKKALIDMLSERFVEHSSPQQVG